MNTETKRNIIAKGQYSEKEYPFMIKPNFSTLCSILEIKPQGPIIGLLFEDSTGELLGFNETILWKEYTLSPNIISFDNIFIETNIAKGMIFKGRRTGIIHNFTMDVNLGYKYVEKYRGGVQLYMMHSKDFISSINKNLIHENGNLVSFNGQSITFRLSIMEI